MNRAKMRSPTEVSDRGLGAFVRHPGRDMADNGPVDRKLLVAA